MHYKKIRVKSLDAPKRFYRLLYVREDLNLFELGVTILLAVDCGFGHMFTLEDQKYVYVDESWVNDTPYLFDLLLSIPKDRDYEKYKISDLVLDANNTFKICYDSGDNWEFEIKIYKVEKDLPGEAFAHLIEGAGASIWEDNRQLFLRFIDSGSDALSAEEKDFLSEMVNADVETFDDPLDIDSLNDNIDRAESTCRLLREMRDSSFD